jgi:tetratricopeptide (TPR) repeat protein
MKLYFYFALMLLISCNGTENAWLPEEHQPSKELIGLNDAAMEKYLLAKNLSDSTSKKVLLDSAKILLKEILSNDSRFHLAASNLFQVNLALKDTVAAEMLINNILKQDPDFAEWWLTYGILKELKGETSEAVEKYQKSADFFSKRLTPGKPKTEIGYNYYYSNLTQQAIALMLLDRKTEALAAWENAEAIKQKTTVLDSGDFYKQLFNSTDRVSFFRKLTESR